VPYTKVTHVACSDISEEHAKFIHEFYCTECVTDRDCNELYTNAKTKTKKSYEKSWKKPELEEQLQQLREMINQRNAQLKK
jgi:hypothetical protein